MEYRTLNTSPRRVAIIQARMSSTRCPGKVLKTLGGLPMIVFMVRRVSKARLVDQVVVATSQDASDDILANVLHEHGIACFRGQLNDVLDRFVQAAREFKADQIVRLTGDCPLMDPDLVDHGLALLAEGDADYVTNTNPPTYPNGLDVECFTREAIENAWQLAKLASEREHVTPFLRKGHAGTRTKNWRAITDLSDFRWTVDHQDDVDHVSALVNAFVKDSGRIEPEAFDRFDLLRSAERHALGQGTLHDRNEGYLKSLALEG